MTAAILSYIPSPPVNGLSVGPLRLHVYGLLIACGIAAAVWLAQRRWEAIGGKPGTMSALAIWGVPGGLIGARVYSLATSWNIDTNGGHIIRAFEVWKGGLGIWGGVAGGIALGAVGVRRRHLPLLPLLDCVAPAFALAQAIGRWGNYFNQELYGWKSNLPWAVKIDHPAVADPSSPTGLYPPGTTFQPTFLYESIWDLIVVVLVIWVERRFRIKRGFLLAAYAAFYTFGRFWTEYMRIDAAHRFFGLRLNDWMSIIVFVAASFVLLVWGRAKDGDDRAGTPLPASAVGGGTAPGPDSDAPDATDVPCGPSQTGVGTTHLPAGPEPPRPSSPATPEPPRPSSPATP
jgi:prolipoprotein diacylglyceryl transferase